MKDIYKDIQEFLDETSDIDEGAISKMLGSLRMDIGRKFFNGLTMKALKNRISDIRDPAARDKASETFKALEEHIKQLSLTLDQLLSFIEINK